MGAADIVREVTRVAGTHGLAKDVIDLMEKKLALLVEEIGLLKEKSRSRPPMCDENSC